MKYLAAVIIGFVFAFAFSASANFLDISLWHEENEITEPILVAQEVQETLVEVDQDDEPLPREKVREVNEREVECLALNIYHEARGSIFVDRAAVTDVVLNRVQDTRYPNTVCGVVQQGRISKWHLENTGKRVPVKHKCQFSWYCDGRSDKPHDKESWEHSKYLAYNMYYYDEYRGITEGATHYHATYVNPDWASHFQIVGRIGNHVYYRWIN